MNNTSRYSRSFSFLTAGALLLLTSCNRGVGCPTNFSLNEFLTEGVSLLIGLPL